MIFDDSLFSRGRSYDMQVAATSIVFLRYAMLSMEIRNANDAAEMIKEIIANLKGGVRNGSAILEICKFSLIQQRFLDEFSKKSV